MNTPRINKVETIIAMESTKICQKLEHEIRAITLKTLKIFKDLDKKLVIELSKFLKIRTFKKRDVIFKQGEFPKSFTLLNKGMVKLVRTLNDSQEMIVNVAVEGEFFGAMALFSQEQYSITAICDTEVTLIEIPKERFFKFMEDHPFMYRTVLKHTSLKNYDFERKVSDMALSKVESRIAKVLLNLARQNGQKVNGFYQMKSFFFAKGNRLNGWIGIRDNNQNIEEI